MKRIVCEMCGSHELVKEDGLFVCPYCGCKYTLEEARKMMIEGNVDVSGSTVKVDDSKELENLYQLARRAKDQGKYTDAREYYSKILLKNPNDWEAVFYSEFCKMAAINSVDRSDSIGEMIKILPTIFNLLSAYEKDSENYRKYAITINNDLVSCVDEYLKAATKMYTDKETINDVDKLEFLRAIFTASIAFNSIADMLYTLSKADDGIKYIVIHHYKDAISGYNGILKIKLQQISDKNVASCIPTVGYYTDLINSCVEKIRYFDSEYEPKLTYRQSSGGCYVATAVYGSYDCPQVWTLRRFRDYTLAESVLGRAFIKTYYAISPTVVKYFGDTVWFNKLFRGVLNKVVAKLNETGVEDTPYEDRVW